MNLKIDVVSNLFNPVGPSAPGGLEVFNYYLVRELEKRNVDVRLIAPGNSAKLKSLKAIIPRSYLGENKDDTVSDPWDYRRITVREFAEYLKYIEKIAEKDRIIHFSMVNFLPVYLAVKQGYRMLFSIHMPVTNYHFQVLKEMLTVDELKKVNFVGVSKHQVKNFTYASRVVHNGVDTEEFVFSEKNSDNYIWIGRLVEGKGCLDAIKAAKLARVKLKIAGSVRTKDEIEYFDKFIKPELDVNITYIGHVGRKERIKFYQAKALLFSPKWNEAFGLTMIEAMSCGTPVIAYNSGAVKEIIINNETGLISKADDVREMAKMINKIELINKSQYLMLRRNCRKHIEKNFSIQRMVNEYIDIYKSL